MNQEEVRISKDLEEIINKKLVNCPFDQKQQVKHQIEEFLDIVFLIVADEISKK